MRVISMGRLPLIAGFAIWVFSACNNSDYKTSENESPVAAADSTGSNNSKTTDNSSTATDNTGSASTPAATPDNKKTGDKNATAPKSAVSTSPAATKRKGRVSVTMASSTSEKLLIDKDGVYSAAEVMPEFPGGKKGLDNYVNGHIQYPSDALDGDVSGIVKVSFVVDENGRVSHAILASDQKLGNGLDEEALKVINSMPAWKPGKVHGKNVKTRLQLPIDFEIS